MKRMICFLTVCFMLFGITSVFAQGVDSFVDVTEEHFAYDAVQYFHQANVLEGVGDNMFAPDEFVTREQFAKMLSIIYGKEKDVEEKETFSDVTSDMWSYAYIESVKEYLTGYYPAGGKAFFNPYGRATREDVAYALVKISGLKDTKTPDLSVLDKYEDSTQISVNLKEYVAIVVDAGLMQGYENRLRPQDGITRAEVATLLFRAIKKPVEVEKEEQKDPENQKEEDKTKETYRVETDSILQISGYREEDISGTLFLEWTPEETATFYADLKCKNSAFDVVDCNITLTEVISVSQNRVIGYFDVRTHGKMRHENIKGTVLVQNATLTLNTEEYDYHLVASLTPKKPQESKPEKEETPEKDEDMWADSKIIFYDVKRFGDEKANGYFKYAYKEEENISMIEAQFTVGENKYTVEMTEELSKAEGHIEGYFSVYCNGELIAENAPAKLMNYKIKIGEMIEFVLDDKSICVTMQIVEIAE